MSELTYGNYSLLDNQQESPLYTAKYDYTALGKSSLSIDIDLKKNKLMKTNFHSLSVF